MIPVILCGKTNDTAITEALVPALARYGSVFYCGSQKLSQYGGESPDFLVADYEKIPSFEAKSGILLFKNSYDAKEKISVSNGFSCILDSQNSHAASALQGASVAAITCGTGPKDTVSIAALDDGSATLSLQRSILTIPGGIVEPRDFMVSLKSPIGPHRILTVCAVMLVSGIDSSAGYKI